MGVPKNEGQSSHNFPPPQTFLQKNPVCIILTIRENCFSGRNCTTSFSGRKLALIQHFTNVRGKKILTCHAQGAFSYFCRPVAIGH